VIVNPACYYLVDLEFPEWLDLCWGDLHRLNIWLIRLNFLLGNDIWSKILLISALFMSGRCNLFSGGTVRVMWGGYFVIWWSWGAMGLLFAIFSCDFRYFSLFYRMIIWDYIWCIIFSLYIYNYICNSKKKFKTLIVQSYGHEIYLHISLHISVLQSMSKIMHHVLITIIYILHIIIKNFNSFRLFFIRYKSFFKIYWIINIFDLYILIIQWMQKNICILYKRMNRV
jgi:hypothetical protein